jgi:uroporphyrinogen decarboxylase
MRQAGRYLPEYRDLRARVSFLDLCRTPELCAEAALQPIQRFDLDAAILFSDILVVLDALGIEVHFDPAPTVASPVRNESDLRKLRLHDLDSTLGYVFQAVTACKQALNDRVPLIGFSGAPFTILCYLVEGGASKDFGHTKALAFSRPDLFARLMESITGLLIPYLEGQVRAGADALQIFESWGAVLGPSDYRELVLPHMIRLRQELSAPGVPLLVFARGTASLLEPLREMAPDVYGIDWTMDLDRAAQRLGPQAVVQGNLDPTVLLAPAEVVAHKTRKILAQGRSARAHVFNRGHGVLPSTDPAVVAHLVDVVHAA